MEKNKLLNAIEVAQEEKIELLQRVAHLDESIASYQKKVSQPNNYPQPQTQTSFSESGYNSKNSWMDKIAHILKTEKRFLHSKQFQEIINQYEPGLEKGLLQRRVSSALARLKKAGAIVNIKIDETNHRVFWGSPVWLNESGEKPQKQHMYDKKYAEDSKFKKRIIE